MARRRHTPIWPNWSLQPQYGAVTLDRSSAGWIDAYLPMAPGWNLGRSGIGPLLNGHGSYLTVNGLAPATVCSPQGALGLDQWANNTVAIIHNFPTSVYLGNTFSWAGWVRVGDSTRYSTILSNGLTYNVSGGWVIEVDNTGKIGLAYNNGSIRGWYQITLPASWTTGAWLHLGVSVDIPAGVFTVYVNGVSAGSNTSLNTTALAVSASNLVYGSKDGSTYGSTISYSDTCFGLSVWPASVFSQLFTNPYWFLRPVVRRSYGFLGGAAARIPIFLRRRRW